MSRVAIVKCNDYDTGNVSDAVKRIFEYLGGVEKYIKPGMRVLLKPNLVLKKRPDEAATTHPAVVQCMAEIIRDAGARAVIIDSPGGLYTEMRLSGVYSVCGMKDAAQKSGAELNYDLSEIDIDNEQGMFLKKVRVTKPLVDADLVINLPKLKTHGQMVYSGAVKNMFGAVPGVLKAEYHFRMPDYDHFANTIIDIFLSVKPALTIMDGIVGMEGWGPTAGDPKPMGILLGSENAFELDYAALSIIGVTPVDVPVLKHAVKRGLCPDSLKKIELCGEVLRDVAADSFSMPQLGSLKAMEFFGRGPLKFMVDRLKPSPAFNHRDCVGCSECAKSCPVHIIEMKNGKPEADLTDCIRCFCCQELCPVKAITIKRNLLLKLLSVKKSGRKT